MALQVWLPLINDIHNYGLCGDVLTTSDAVFTNGGKIGAKYLSSGTITIPAAISKNIFNKNHMTFAFWLYPIGSGSTSNRIMGQSSMSAGNNRMYSIFQYANVNDLHLSWQDETSASTFLTTRITDFFPTDTWTHCCITYDGSKAIIYQNGLQHTIINGTSNRTSFEYDFPILGNATNRLNDVRIYDEVLSPLEIKRISQGLVAHYPLNNNGLGNDNLLINTREMQNISNKCIWYPPATTNPVSDGVCTLVGDGAWRSIGCANGLRLDQYKGKTVTISADIRAVSSDATYRPIAEYRTIQTAFTSTRKWKYKNINLTCVDGTTVPNTTWKRFYGSLTLNEGVFVSYDNANMNAEPDWIKGYLCVLIFNHGNVDYQVRNMKLEVGDSATAYAPASFDFENNYLLNTTTESVHDVDCFDHSGTMYSIKDIYMMSAPVSELFKVGDIVTFSFDWEYTGTTYEGNFHTEVGNVTPWGMGTVLAAIGTRGMTSNYIDITSTNTSGHAEVTYSVSAAAVAAANTFKYFRIRKDNVPLGTSITFRNCKLIKTYEEYDVSGYNRNITRFNSPVISSSSPRYLSSTQFNGSNQLAYSTSVRTGIVGDCALTMSAWIYWDLDSWRSDYVGIFGNNTYSTNAGAWMLIYNGRPDFDTWNQRYIATNALSVKTWHHICIVKEPGDLSATTKIYVNGSLVAGTGTTTAAPSYVDAGMFVGRSSNTANRHFPGKISDVRLYATALSADDVKALYEDSAYIATDGTGYAYEFVEE